MATPPYIEKDPLTSYNGEICDGTHTGGGCDSGVIEVADASKYDYLKDFNKMTDEQKYALFLPMCVFVYTQGYNTNHQKIDIIINHRITETHMNTGRLIDNIQYDFSHQGVPTIMLVFKPLHMSIIPEPYKSTLETWGRNHYMIP